jgi:hypothetical protein
MSRNSEIWRTLVADVSIVWIAVLIGCSSDAGAGEIARVGGIVRIRKADITFVRALNPGLDTGGAKRLAVDACVVWLAEKGAPRELSSELDVQEALTAHAQFLRRMELENAGPVEHWAGEAAKEIDQLRRKFGVEWRSE